MIDITFKKVNIVSTSETIVAVENQKDPTSTAGVSDNGTVQPKPVNQSLLRGGIDFVQQILGW